MSWKIVYTKQAQKDARKIAASGLKNRVQNILSMRIRFRVAGQTGSKMSERWLTFRIYSTGVRFNECPEELNTL